MQYWLCSFKWGHGNVLIGKYDTLDEAKTVMNRMDFNEYEYADIIETEWQKQPRWVCGVNFEYEKTKVKRVVR